MRARNKDIEKMLAPFRKSGWELVYSKGTGHTKLFSPDGVFRGVVTMNVTESHALANTKANLRRMLDSFVG